jgi:hypothetical protein
MLDEFIGLWKLLKRGELGVHLGESLLQHLTMAEFEGGLELLSETLVGEQQAVAFTGEELLGGRGRRVDGIPAVCHLFLLLFYGFTLPTAGHLTMLPQAGGKCEFAEVRAMELRTGIFGWLELVLEFAIFSAKLTT